MIKSLVGKRHQECCSSQGWERDTGIQVNSRVGKRHLEFKSIHEWKLRHQECAFFFNPRVGTRHLEFIESVGNEVSGFIVDS